MDGYGRFTNVDHESDDTMKQIRAQADRLVKLQAHEAEVQAELKRTQDEIRDVAERDLPTLMDSVDMTEFKLSNGFVLDIKENIRHSISQANRPTAYQWLEDNGYGAAIRRALQIEFDKDQLPAAKHLMEELESGGYRVHTEDKIPPATVGALIRELLAEGKDVPLELFGVFHQRVARLRRSR